MKNIYRHTDTIIEKLVSAIMALPGNSIAFIIALCMVIFYVSNEHFYTLTYIIVQAMLFPESLS